MYYIFVHVYPYEIHSWGIHVTRLFDTELRAPTVQLWKPLKRNKTIFYLRASDLITNTEISDNAKIMHIEKFIRSESGVGWMLYLKSNNAIC